MVELWTTIQDDTKPAILGFGCMRFPLDRKSHTVDKGYAKKLIEKGMGQGICYYDTAWPYHNGENEPILGELLSSYPREQYLLATKLPCWEIESAEQADQILREQLLRLRTDYVDCYLLHSLTRKTWEKMKQLHIPERLSQYQEEGLVRHVGFSFHDEYEVFTDIVGNRKWDFCQIQLNYMDQTYQAGLQGLKLAREMGIPVVVMEPLKGGALTHLPEEAALPLREIDPHASDASWALRWVASQPGVRVVLSGMADESEIEENMALFSPLRPLNQEEFAAVEETARRLRQRIKNGCTGCRYCTPCPKGVDIPKVFQIWNQMGMYQNQRLIRRAWKGVEEQARPKQCVNCGRCASLCPQHLPIPLQLNRAEEELESFVNRP